MSTLDEQEEINRFLRGHRVLAIDKHYDDCRGLWTFAVTYIDGNMPSSGKVSSSEKVDYKEVLSTEEFERFTALRKRRKSIAEAEAIPAFAVFTDKELAEMSRVENLTIKDLLSIEGINKGRAQRYGAELLTPEPQQPK